MATKNPDLSRQEASFCRKVHQRACAKLLLSWFFATIFAVAVIVLVNTYETKGVLTPSQKDAYNVLSIGLILLLSISLIETLKDLANNLGPFIQHLSKDKRADQVLADRFDLLLNVLRHVLSASTITLRLLCALWLLINLIFLIAPAIQAVVCQLDDGRDYNGTYVRIGTPTVSNRACYFHGHGCARNQVELDQLAHAYGEMTLGAQSADPENCGTFTDIQSIIDSRKDYRYYCRRNTTVQEFGIRFNEYNGNDKRRVYPHFTQRVITAWSEPCNEYPQVGDPERTTIGNPKTDGTNFISAFNHTYAINSTSNGSIAIPTSALGNDGTTYIYRGIFKPQNAITYGHGPRGLKMWAYRNPGQDRRPRFYECDITVSNVTDGPFTNVVGFPFNISDEMAREAAASIALQGQYKGPGENPVFTQWQWYADRHPWNIQKDTTNSGVGANIAEHAIVSLAEMIANNPTIEAPGKVPYLGTKLNVKWSYFAALMGSIIVCNSLVSVLGLMAILKNSKSESSYEETELQSRDIERGEHRHLVGNGSSR